MNDRVESSRSRKSSRARTGALVGLLLAAQVRRLAHTVNGSPASNFTSSPRVRPFGTDCRREVESFCRRESPRSASRTVPAAGARISPLATAAEIQRNVGIETILHFCCRDRNLVGMQADLSRMCRSGRAANIAFL